MKFFVDTANIEQIKKAHQLGIVDGVTTNPSLIAKEGKDFKTIVKEITGVVDGPISAEVLAVEAEDMVKQGVELAQIHPNIVIKIPMTEEGLKAIFQLTQKGIKTNATLIFSPNQALMAAKAGATYVSPFVGRLDDISHDGMILIRDIVQMFKQYDDIKTEVLAASIRNPLQVIESAKVGAHVATIPFDVLEKMARHPKTDEGLRKFIADAEKSGQKI